MVITHLLVKHSSSPVRECSIHLTVLLASASESVGIKLLCISSSQ